MTEDEARQFELVRAVELQDREAGLLTREDRAQADVHARSVTDSTRPRLSDVGSSRVDLQACKLEYSIVSPK